MVQCASTGVVEADDDRASEKALDVVWTDPHLDRIAENIARRDRAAAKFAHDQWLENGRDLLEAKSILGHGNFEEWCKRKLNYSIRTAQKLMQAAEVFEPYLKNEPSSFLPKPSVVYALSSPSVPQNIRDVYAPRLVAGENVVSDVRNAILQHRKDRREEKERETRRAAKLPEAQKAMAKREAAEVGRRVRETEKDRQEQERRSEALSAALTFISERLSDDLPKLMALAAEAGPGGVFSSTAEHELQKRAQERALLPRKARSDVAIDEAEFVSPQDVTDLALGERSGSMRLSPPEINREHGAGEAPIGEPIVADCAVAKMNATSASKIGKFGDLRAVLRSFYHMRDQAKA